MIKRSKWVYIVGSVIIGIVSVLFIFSGLIFSGVIDASSRKLVFSSAGTYKTYDGQVLTLDKWELSDGTLKDGHKAQVKMLGSQLDVGKSENDFSVVILDANGADVTSDYEIEYKKGTLEVKPFELTVSADDVSREYNGKPLTGNDAKGDGYSLDKELPAGHEVEVEFVGLLVNAGSKDNTPSVSIFFEGRDVTSNFNVQALSGTLTVNPVELVIQSFTTKKIYDGKPCESKDGIDYKIVTGELVGTDEIEIILLHQPTDVGKYDNEFVVNFIKGEKNNYKIENKTGKLEIEKFKIELTTEGDNWTYDGKRHALKESTMFPAELPVGKLIVDETSFKSIKNVKESCENSVLYTFEGAKESNYEVETKFGTLQIDPLDVKVTTKSLSWTFDGRKHYMAYNTENQQHVSFYCSAPVSGETFTWDEDISSYVQYVTDVDRINKIYYSVVNGDMDNYAFEENFGTLTIEKRSIIVEVEEQRYTYDGQAHPSLEERELIGAKCADLSGTDLVFDYEIGSFAAITDCDMKQEIPLNWTITCNNVLVSEDNFDVTQKLGEIKIEKRDVVLSTPSKYQVYNGVALTTEDELIQVEGSLVGGHYCVVDCTGSVLYVTDGTVKNTFRNFDIKDGNNQSVLKNYNWQIDEGELYIEPRSIAIEPKDYIAIYDGEEHIVEDPECSGLPVVVDHEFLLTAEYQPLIAKNAGRMTYSLDDDDRGAFKWLIQRNYYDENGDLHSEIVDQENFHVSYLDGTINVRKYSLKITTMNYSTEYDGNYQGPPSIEYGDYYEINGEDYDFLGRLSHGFAPAFNLQKDIGVYMLDLDTANCFVTDYNTNENVTGNYDVQYEQKGTFIIRKILIHVTTGDTRSAEDQSAFVYDGTPKSYTENLSYDASKLLHGHEMEFSNFAQATDCVTDVDGAYIGIENTVDWIIKENEENVSKYYDVQFTYGRLIVRPVEFLLETDAWTDKYKNEAWQHTVVTDNTVAEFTRLENDFGVTVELSNWAEALNVQEGGIPNSCSYTVKKGGKDVTHNFKATEKFGSLVVQPVEIYINAISSTRQYDGTVWEAELLSKEGVTDSGALSGHVVDYQLNAPTVATVGVKVNYEITNKTVKTANGEDVTGNYVFICDAYREITPRKIIVISDSGTWKYDGKEHTLHSVHLSFYSLVEGHEFSQITYTGSQTEIGTSKNEFSIDKIVDAFGNDVTMYYDVRIVVGELTVTA